MATSAPVVKTRRLACSPEHAFATFTAEVGRWWPTATHAIGDDVADVVLEPRVGGSMHEVAADGSRTTWGEVTAWDPPRRVAFTWHLARAEGTHVDVAFAPSTLDDGTDGCDLRLVHDGWEHWGDEGAERRDQYDEGWDHVLGQYVDLLAVP